MPKCPNLARSRISKAEISRASKFHIFHKGQAILLHACTIDPFWKASAGLRSDQATAARLSVLTFGAAQLAAAAGGAENQLCAKTDGAQEAASLTDSVTPDYRRQSRAGASGANTAGAAPECGPQAGGPFCPSQSSG